MDVILERVRDTQSQFHSRAFVRRVISNVQWQMYLLLKPELSQTALTTSPGINHYRLTTNNLGLRIAGIRDGGRDLSRVDDITKLAYIDRQWWTKRADRHELWTQLGQDYVIVYPTSYTSVMLDIIYVPMYIAYTSDSQTVFIPTEYHEPLIKIAEALILLRQKDFNAAQRAMNLFLEESAPELLADRLHLPVEQAVQQGAYKEG